MYAEGTLACVSASVQSATAVNITSNAYRSMLCLLLTCTAYMYTYMTHKYRLFVTTMMNPFDVVSTRMYSQSAKHAVYSGPIDCFVKTFRAEGIKGFYKVSGVSPS
jgi:Mitochondrial carrier protein